MEFIAFIQESTTIPRSDAVRSWFCSTFTLFPRIRLRLHMDSHWIHRPLPPGAVYYLLRLLPFIAFIVDFDANPKLPAPRPRGALYYLLRLLCFIAFIGISQFYCVYWPIKAKKIHQGGGLPYSRPVWAASGWSGWSGRSYHLVEPLK